MKILIIDDSLFVQNFIRKVIQDNIPGCETVIANNGELGYSLYKEFSPDIILTDLLMPGLSGQELLRRIRGEDQQVKVVVISADVQRVTREEVEKLGILEFVNKPLNAEKAEKLVKLILEVNNAE